MKHGVLGVVLETVGDHQVKVLLQVGDGAVHVSLKFGAHGGKVHGLGDELQVIGDLEEDGDETNQDEKNAAVVTRLKLLDLNKSRWTNLG